MGAPPRWPTERALAGTAMAVRSRVDCSAAPSVSRCPPARRELLCASRARKPQASPAKAGCSPGQRTPRKRRRSTPGSRPRGRACICRGGQHAGLASLSDHRRAGRPRKLWKTGIARPAASMRRSGRRLRGEKAPASDRTRGQVFCAITSVNIPQSPARTNLNATLMPYSATRSRVPTPMPSPRDGQDTSYCRCTIPNQSLHIGLRHRLRRLRARCQIGRRSERFNRPAEPRGLNPCLTPTTTTVVLSW